MSEGTCLNCGSDRARAYCPDCGQRHVPREDYDLQGLVGDYTRQVVSKLKVVRTLWGLIRHPGSLTTAFMDGKRIEQVNPLWLYLFVWSTVVTLARLMWQPETGELLEQTMRTVPELVSGELSLPGLSITSDFGTLPEEKIRESVEPLVLAQPVALTVMAYVGPLVGLLWQTVTVRALLSRSWLESGVYALHVGTVAFLLGLPSYLSIAWFGLWGDQFWVTQGAAAVVTLLVLVYDAMAARAVFADRVSKFWWRFALMWILGSLLTSGTSSILSLVATMAAAVWYGFTF